MPRPKMPLEELGLLCLLEKVGEPDGDMDAYARYGLVENGWITDGDPPRLTRKGADRMAELRAWRAEGEVDTEVRSPLRP